MVAMKKTSIRMTSSSLKKASGGRTSYMELDPSKRRPKENDKEERIEAARLKKAAGGVGDELNKKWQEAQRLLNNNK